MKRILTASRRRLATSHTQVGSTLRTRQALEHSRPIYSANIRELEDVKTEPLPKHKPSRRSRNRKPKSGLPFQINISKKDASGECSRELIRQLEIKDALTTFNSQEDKSVTMEQIQNSNELIQKFAFARTAPDVIISRAKIVFLTSEGEGIAIVPKITYASEQEGFENSYAAILVPKTVPGDIVTISLRRHFSNYVEGVVESFDSKAPGRDDGLVRCEKFDECAGCQLQMLSYEDQLEYKRNTIKKAYRYFYPEIPTSTIGKVFGSPLQYGYRTKLTPHSTSLDAIGFNNVHSWKGTVDITKCDIAMPVINRAFQKTKSRMSGENTKGAALCFRRSFDINIDTGIATEVCEEKPQGWVTEVIGNTVLQFKNHHFFQNNASILPLVLEYIQSLLKEASNGKQFKYIIDTYCGSGFFGICLANNNAISEDGKVYGIEIASEPVEYAKRNAKLNGLEERVHFIAGDAHEMFRNQHFLSSDVKGEDSVVIMDPSRKGSDEIFLKQIKEFQPRLVVYISCNVFTQARDLAMFHEMAPNYKLKSVVGFDFFPQTKHVETIAVLELTQ